MALVRQPIPALYGGVSQQAASVRGSNQCEAALNCYFTVADGSSKRPPMELIAELQTYATDDEGAVSPAKHAWFHIPFPNSDGFVLQLPGDGTYRLYKVHDGTTITRINDTAQDYLTVPSDTSAIREFRVVTVGRRVYIVNSTVRVAIAETTAPGTLSGQAQTLQDAVLDAAGDGTIWRILGDEANPYDTYYAKKVGSQFVEWLKPGVAFEFDETTMPHIIDLVADEVDPTGYVATYSAGNWADRLVGDEKSNKNPSFVGLPITAVFFAHDRLGFSADNKAIWSETGEYGNFWRTTVTDLLDTDRIDVGVSSDGSSLLRWAKPLGKSTILFADERQFSMDGTAMFSPRTVSSTQATAYPCSRICAPVSSGPNVYFASNTENATQVWEMFVQDDAVTNDAANVTAHVQSYIDTEIEGMAVNNNFDTMLLHRFSSATLWCYQSYWQGDEKIQSAWGKWQLSGSVVDSMFPFRDYIYAVTHLVHDGQFKMNLCRFNLKNRVASAGLTSTLGHPILLDQLTRTNGTYNSGEGKTYFTSPFPLMADEFVDLARMVVAEGPNTGRLYRLTNPGPVVIHPGPDDYSFAVVGDWSAYAVFLGLNYTQRFTPSEQFYVENNRPVLNARTQLRTMAVNYKDTAYFGTEVKVLGSDQHIGEFVPALVSTFSARTVGNENFQLNRPQLTSGTYRFPVLGRSSEVTISLVNDEYTPSHFISMEWEGLVTKRTR